MLSSKGIFVSCHVACVEWSRVSLMRRHHSRGGVLVHSVKLSTGTVDRTCQRRVWRSCVHKSKMEKGMPLCLRVDTVGVAQERVRSGESPGIFFHKTRAAHRVR